MKAFIATALVAVSVIAGVATASTSANAFDAKQFFTAQEARG